MAANWHRFPTGSSNVIFNTPNEWTPNSWIDPCGRWKHGWSENPEWRQNKGTGLEMCTCPEWLQKSKGIPLRVFINKSSTSAKGRTPGPQPKALWSGTRLEFWQLSQRPKQTFWLVVSTHLHTWNVCRCIYIYTVVTIVTIVHVHSDPHATMENIIQFQPPTNTWICEFLGKTSRQLASPKTNGSLRVRNRRQFTGRGQKNFTGTYSFFVTQVTSWLNSRYPIWKHGCLSYPNTTCQNEWNRQLSSHSSPLWDRQRWFWPFSTPHRSEFAQGLAWPASSLSVQIRSRRDWTCCLPDRTIIHTRGHVSSLLVNLCLFFKHLGCSSNVVTQWRMFHCRGLRCAIPNSQRGCGFIWIDPKWGIPKRS